MTGKVRSRRFSLVKAKEILLWLQNQETEVESYVVLDDLTLHDERISSHQVKTDGRLGLTEEDVKMAEKILGETEEKRDFSKSGKRNGFLIRRSMSRKSFSPEKAG